MADGIQPVMNVENNNCWTWILVLFILMGGNWGNWNNRNDNAMELMQGQARLEKAVYDSNNNQTIGDQIRGITYGIADSTYALNNAIGNVGQSLTRDNFGIQKDILVGNGNIQRDLMGVGNGIQRSVSEIGYQATIQGLNNTNMLGQAINQNRFDYANGICATNHNIDSVKYDNAMNTCRITNNATELTQKVLDRIDRLESNAKDSEIANLRQQLAGANLLASQQAQNAQLVQTLRPFPNPAYIVSSPYGNCNCGVI